MAVNSTEKKMSRQEAGRKGGKKVARERGPEFYRRIGKKGGEKVAEERGIEFYREIGRKGGKKKASAKKKHNESKSWMKCLGLRGNYQKVEISYFKYFGL